MHWLGHAIFALRVSVHFAWLGRVPKRWIVTPEPETNKLRREITLARSENVFALGGRSRGVLETACIAVFVGIACIRASLRFDGACETA